MDSEAVGSTLKGKNNPKASVNSYSHSSMRTQLTRHFVEKEEEGKLLRYTIVDFGRQKVLFGKRGELVIKKKGGPRLFSYN